MLKKCVCLLFAIMLSFSLSGCTDIFRGAIFLFLVVASDDRADQRDIVEFVCENEEELLKAIEDSDFSSFENQGFIKDVDPDENVVDFSCGGAGIGSGTSYVGFYYTVNNDMGAAWCAPAANLLTPSGNGYSWQEPGGDNRYYTEHITGNFYYYEASF